MQSDVAISNRRSTLFMIVTGAIVTIVAVGIIALLWRPRPSLDDVLREELPNTSISYKDFLDKVDQRYGFDEGNKAWYLKPEAGPGARTRYSTAAEWLSNESLQFTWLTPEEPSRIYRIYEISFSDYGTKLKAAANNIHYWFAVDRDDMIIAYAIRRTR